MTTDLTTYDDSALDALRVQVLTEQERRHNRTQMPDQIAAMAQAFVDAGGETTALPDLTQLTPSPLPFEIVTDPTPDETVVEVDAESDFPTFADLAASKTVDEPVED